MINVKHGVNMKKVLWLVIVLLVEGCAGSPARIALLSADEMKKETSYDLCNAYANHGHSSTAIKDELISRGEIDYLDWSDIDNGRIKIGMSELGLICSMGSPGVFGGVRKSVSAYGTNKQYFYRNHSRGKIFTVIVDNEKISNYQE